MFCGQCGNQLKVDALFCGNCGQPKHTKPPVTEVAVTQVEELPLPKKTENAPVAIQEPHATEQIAVHKNRKSVFVVGMVVIIAVAGIGLWQGGVFSTGMDTSINAETSAALNAPQTTIPTPTPTPAGQPPQPIAPPAVAEPVPVEQSAGVLAIDREQGLTALGAVLLEVIEDYGLSWQHPNLEDPWSPVQGMGLQSVHFFDFENSGIPQMLYVIAEHPWGIEGRLVSYDLSTGQANVMFYAWENFGGSSGEYFDVVFNPVTEGIYFYTHFSHAFGFSNTFTTILDGQPHSGFFASGETDWDAATSSILVSEVWVNGAPATEAEMSEVQRALGFTDAVSLLGEFRYDTLLDNHPSIEDAFTFLGLDVTFLLQERLLN